MPTDLELLEPAEELRYLREDLGIVEPGRLMRQVVDNFMVLQARSAMLLSLITLCLTISGFSGHRISAAGLVPASLLGMGLVLAVSAAALLLQGPLKLRWATRMAAASGLEDTLVELIRQRNHRTRRYHQATGVLVAGLCSYTASLVLFILQEGLR